MVNDFQYGSVVQGIINGTDKFPKPDRKRFIYLVYEDWHGYQCACGTLERATEMVKMIAFSGGLPQDTPIDYDSEERWGWEGVACWVKEEVIE